MADASLGGLPFAKMHGAGNDFVMVDARDLAGRGPLEEHEIRMLCDRRTGVGADGLIVVEPDAAGGGLGMHYWNADGGRAAMCGNGARCTVAFARRRGLCADQGVLRTDAGDLRFAVHGPADIAIELPPCRDLQLDLDLAGATALPAHACDTGVPHLVLMTDDLDAVDVAADGPALRRHPRFAPAGTNVDWLQHDPAAGVWRLRTYERGVEAETLACGTGAAACAVVAMRLGLAASPVAVRTRRGDLLRITEDDADRSLWLRGPAVLAFVGEVNDDA